MCIRDRHPEAVSQKWDHRTEIAFPMATGARQQQQHRGILCTKCVDFHRDTFLLYLYFPPVNRRDIFLRIGQSFWLGKANFSFYKKPLLSGPSAKIIRPAVSSVKEFRHFRRFWKRFRYWSFPCGIEEAKRFSHRKNFAPVNLSVSAWQRPVGALFLLREFVLPNHLRGFAPAFFCIDC